MQTIWTIAHLRWQQSAPQGLPLTILTADTDGNIDVLGSVSTTILGAGAEQDVYSFTLSTKSGVF
ncbi:MAG: hypothetical protein R3C17_20870 [Planctomycetaceae bacterium]